MDVCADYFGDPPCEEVPDDDAAVVAAHSQQGAPAVEGAGEGHADAVQSPIGLLSTGRDTEFSFLFLKPEAHTEGGV